MMRAKVKTIKHGIKSGTSVPIKQHAGNVGRWAEKVLSNNGYILDNGKCVDIPGLNTEVKTRKIESNSAHTIATMSIDSVKTTDYFDSIVYKKFQQQYRIYYSDDQSVVIGDRVVDFSDPYIQSKISEGYAIIQKDIKNGCGNRYIASNGWLVAELTKSGGSYQFRVPNSAMKKFESIATNKFNEFFSYD